MSTYKEDIEYQVRALKAYEKALEIKDAENDDIRKNIENDNQRREYYFQALKIYKDLGDQVGENSKICFNVGMIHATVGEHEQAVKMFIKATSYDQYLAVAYFQEGVSNFLLGKFEEASENFNDALMYLRGNRCINYEQLGLKFRLYSCETLFNRGLSYIYMGEQDQGMRDLNAASAETQTNEHSVIGDAIRDRAEGYTVFSVPVGVLFRPSEQKINNMARKNYLGEAKLVAATDNRDKHTGFTGAEVKAQEELRRTPSTRSPTTSTSSASTFTTHALVNPSRPKLRNRSQSDIGPKNEENNMRSPPFPVKQSNTNSSRREILPPTPPSEPENSTGRRSRSQPPQRSQSLSARSSGSSYSAPNRRRLMPRIEDDSDREEDDRSSGPRAEELRRSQSMGGSYNKEGVRRRPTKADRTRGDNRNQDYYENLVDDYYEDVPRRAATLKRAASKRALSRNRPIRDLSIEDDDDDDASSSYSNDDFRIISKPRPIKDIRISLFVNGSKMAKNLMMNIEEMPSFDEFLRRVAQKLRVEMQDLQVLSYEEENGPMSELSDQEELNCLVRLAKEKANLESLEFGRAMVFVTI